ncbi:MAG: hypothetical protein Q9217_006984 [Psora testacea]
MPSKKDVQSLFTARIDDWRREVAKNHSLRTAKNPPEGSLPQLTASSARYYTRLQARTSKPAPPLIRSPLADTTSNPRLRKRQWQEQATPQYLKKRRTMADHGEWGDEAFEDYEEYEHVKVDPPEKRKPGRPKGSGKSKARGRSEEVNLNPSESASRKSKSQSPRKPRGKDIDQDEYKSDSNTPRKTKLLPQDAHFLNPGQTPYPSFALPRLKNIVSKIVSDAAWNQIVGAHEGQWGSLLSRIITELGDLPSGEHFKLINVYEFLVSFPSPENMLILLSETTAINPRQVRPTLPDETPVVLEDDVASSTITSQSPQEVARMIDWTLALKLTTEELFVITEAFKKLKMNEGSLNQTLSFTSLCPLFLDFELKKSYTNHDPKIQLAVWKAAELRKKSLHRWDTSMPMPGITVNGHNWEYFLFYPISNSKGELVLIMMGPEHFGLTANVKGVWEILYRLQVLINWGNNEYREWMNNHIMSWAQYEATR